MPVGLTRRSKERHQYTAAPCIAIPKLARCGRWLDPRGWSGPLQGLGAWEPCDWAPIRQTSWLLVALALVHCRYWSSYCRGCRKRGRVGSARAPTGRLFRVGGSPRVPQGGDGQRKRHRLAARGPGLEAGGDSIPLGISTEHEVSVALGAATAEQMTRAVSATVLPLCGRICRSVLGDGSPSDEDLASFVFVPALHGVPATHFWPSKDACGASFAEGGNGGPTVSHTCSHPATYQLRPPPDVVEQPAFFSRPPGLEAFPAREKIKATNRDVPWLCFRWSFFKMKSFLKLDVDDPSTPFDLVRSQMAGMQETKRNIKKRGLPDDWIRSKIGQAWRYPSSKDYVQMKG